MCECSREGECVSVSVCERGKVCVKRMCVCVCKVDGRESVCVCVCVCVCV